MADVACAARCGRTMPRGNFLCRRCWYVLPRHLKQAYLEARATLGTDRSRSAIDALQAAKQQALESIRPIPRGPRS